MKEGISYNKYNTSAIYVTRSPLKSQGPSMKNCVKCISIFLFSLKMEESNLPKSKTNNLVNILHEKCNI